MKINSGRNATCGTERTNNRVHQMVRTAPLWTFLYVYYITGDYMFHDNAM